MVFTIFKRAILLDIPCVYGLKSKIADHQKSRAYIVEKLASPNKDNVVKDTDPWHTTDV